MRGRWDERKKWGFHIIESWKLFFDTGREIGQITGDFKPEDVVKNDLVDGANSFDAAKVKADADGFTLADDYRRSTSTRSEGALTSYSESGGAL